MVGATVLPESDDEPVIVVGAVVATSVASPWLAVPVGPGGGVEFELCWSSSQPDNSAADNKIAEKQVKIRTRVNRRRTHLEKYMRVPPCGGMLLATEAPRPLQASTQGRVAHPRPDKGRLNP